MLRNCSFFSHALLSATAFCDSVRLGASKDKWRGRGLRGRHLLEDNEWPKAVHVAHGHWAFVLPFLLRHRKL
jgi:hypothetical protein